MDRLPSGTNSPICSVVRSASLCLCRTVCSTFAAAEGEAELGGLELSLLTCPLLSYPEPWPKAAPQLLCNDQEPRDILVFAVLL